jgi:hypothetical protein
VRQIIDIDNLQAPAGGLIIDVSDGERLASRPLHSRHKGGAPLFRTATLALMVVACTTSSTPRPTPEPTLSVADAISQYVDTWGGSRSQYQVIFKAACPELEVLLNRLVEKMDAEEFESPEWRSALGYSNAVNERELALDC